jgi:predicted RNase H-like HicB family nuclease
LGYLSRKEIPGANGQGETIEEAKESLKSAIQLILEERLTDIRRGLPKEAIEETISIP